MCLTVIQEASVNNINTHSPSSLPDQCTPDDLVLTVVHPFLLE